MQTSLRWLHSVGMPRCLNSKLNTMPAKNRAGFYHARKQGSIPTIPTKEQNSDYLKGEMECGSGVPRAEVQAYGRVENPTN